ncbi:MAG: hypothetical protein HQK49_06635 [Oligoflexia bacterium]|nr:hypothetical protein [Oligoflexia bacterium]
MKASIEVKFNNNSNYNDSKKGTEAGYMEKIMCFLTESVLTNIDKCSIEELNNLIALRKELRMYLYN